MKKIFNVFKWAILAVGLMTFTFSCDDKEGDGDSQETPTYSTEESKDKLDASMTQVAQDLETVTSFKSIELIDSMSKMDMEDVTPPDFESLMNTVEASEGTSIDDMETAIEEGLVKLTMSGHIDWGTFTFQHAADSFTFAAGNVGTMILEIPSEEAATTNDVEVKVMVTFKDYSSYETTIEGMEMGEDDNYEPLYADIEIEEIFTDLVFTIKQSNATLLKYEFHTTLDSEGLPNSLETSLMIEEFKVSYEVDATDRDNKISQGASFELDDEEIIGYTVTWDGDLSQDRVEELIDSAEMYDENEQEPSDDFLSELDYDLTVQLRMADFIIEGFADGSKIYDAYDGYEGDLDEDPTMTDVEYIAEEINKAMSLIFKYKDGATIGTVEAFATSYVDTSYNWDGNTEQMEEKTYYEVLPRFKFEDDTYISPEDEDAAQSELEIIFEDFIDAMETLETKFNEKTEGIEIGSSEEDEPMPYDDVDHM